MKNKISLTPYEEELKKVDFRIIRNEIQQEKNRIKEFEKSVDSLEKTIKKIIKFGRGE